MSYYFFVGDKKDDQKVVPEVYREDVAAYLVEHTSG